MAHRSSGVDTVCCPPPAPLPRSAAWSLVAILTEVLRDLALLPGRAKEGASPGKGEAVDGQGGPPHQEPPLEPPVAAVGARQPVDEESDDVPDRERQRVDIEVSELDGAE